MGGHILYLHRQKRARPDVQGNIGDIHPPRRQGLQQRRIKMQRGGWRRNSTRGFRPNGLIIIFVLRIRRPFGRDIGGQRHRPNLGQCRVEIIACQVKPQRRLALGAPLAGGRKLVGKYHLFTIGQFAQGLDQGRPAAIGARFQQGHLDTRLDRPLGRLPPPHAAEPGGNDLGVVQNQPVARAQPLRQVKHMPIMQPRPIADQEPRRRARLGRAGGNQIFWQIKVKIGQLHMRPCGVS